MFEVGVVGQFEAAHRLHGNFGPATRLHGHTYRVEVTARGPSLREDGTLFDIGLLQQALDTALEALHYRDLGDIPAFASRNSTAEAVALHLFEEISRQIRSPGLTSLLVRIWESPQACAAYEGTL